MATEGSGRAAGSRRGRGRQRRPPTWEISDSDPEDTAGARAAPTVQAPAGGREARAEALRLLRPDLALQRLTVHVDPAVLEGAGAHVLLEDLGALGCECLVEPQRRARSLRWSSSKPDPCPHSVPPGVWGSEEQDVLQLLEPEEFLHGVLQLTQTYDHSCPMPWLCPESPGRPYLAVVGLDAHLWSCQPSARSTQQSEHLEAAAPEPVIGWPEVEEALVLLQLWAGLDVLLVPTWQELARHMCAFTKALAQRPYKQLRKSQAFPFCTAGRWAVGARVAKDGSGLLEAWRQQITQFNRVSQAVADAVVSAFPSPRLLQQAFAACSTERERLGLLAHLPVKPDKDAEDKGVRVRRVGPDLARRIFLFLTTMEPDLLLDVGS